MHFYKKYILALLLPFLCNSSFAQLTAGVEGININSGTIFSNDGLVLKPSSNFTLSNNTLIRVATPLSNGAATSSITRVYNFGGAINFTGLAGIYYQDVELNSNTASILTVIHKTATNAYVNTGVGTVDIATRYASQTLTGASISQISLINHNTVLPIDLTFFTASAVNNQVKLNWATSKEQKHAYFEVERSTDGVLFTTLAKVEKATTSGAVKDYEATDHSPLGGINYYRLLQYDSDGTKTELGVRKVKFQLANALVKVYPNPIVKNIYIQLNDGSNDNLSVSLSNLSGQTIAKDIVKSNGSGYEWILKTKPAPGVYILKMNTLNFNHSAKVIVL